MKIKIFSTHTLAIVGRAEALEREFNVWVQEMESKKGDDGFPLFVHILKVDYKVAQRKNTSGMGYEEMVLIVIYEYPMLSPKKP